MVFRLGWWVAVGARASLAGLVVAFAVWRCCGGVGAVSVTIES